MREFLIRSDTERRLVGCEADGGQQESEEDEDDEEDVGAGTGFVFDVGGVASEIPSPRLPI